MSPIDSWDEATYVFTGGPDSFLTVLSVVVAVVMFVGFIAVMVRHEKHAYAQMIHHEPVEKGPAVEGEPQVY
ncbi:hypothetical protein [uncultured Nocardioides sp.]|uniref:hypothetical protein n=1 Tax=uncultured Nocardioides sp. TaxID=198441 RepID=UPI002620EA12|nr:hypothetical protein [uncultured Nocardioides sp.]